MSATHVRLRFVGLYFDKLVEKEKISETAVTNGRDSQTVTVQDVMDAYIKDFPSLNNPGGLAYQTQKPSGQPDKETLLAASHFFDGSYEILAPGAPSTGDGRTIGGVRRERGLYTLQEVPIVGATGVVAWQYYALQSDPNDPTFEKRLSRTLTPDGFRPPTPDDTPGGFQAFTKATFNIKQLDTVIWRMVAILRRPEIAKPASPEEQDKALGTFAYVGT